MSGLFALASGTLIADPQRREGRKGGFATATIRVQAEDDAVLVSTIVFGDAAEQLLGLSKGDAVSVGGRATISTWTGRDGVEKHGLSIVADQIAAAKPQRRSLARREVRCIDRPSPPGPQQSR